MGKRPETPFDCIEGTYDYIDLLARTIDEVREDIDDELGRADADRAERRKEALQLVNDNLVKLRGHITNSRRILNDLRTLRRLLVEERAKSTPV